MCYFSSISVSFKIIETRFGVQFVEHESFMPVYSASAFTFPSLPVISNEDAKHVTMMHWGLIPFWVKDTDSAMSIREKTLNSRDDTIFEKPAFRHSIVSKRCLVLADGFFEWRHIKNKTYPYFIKLKDNTPFAFAGIWDSWTNPKTKERRKTFSVITTRANSLLEKIHNTKKRMPVILPRDRERVWLQDDLNKNAVQSLLEPYDPAGMEAYPVSKMVHNLGLNTSHPEVTARQEYAELPD